MRAVVVQGAAGTKIDASTPHFRFFGKRGEKKASFKYNNFGDFLLNDVKKNCETHVSDERRPAQAGGSTRP